LAGLNRFQELQIGSATGTEWFHSQRVDAVRAEVIEQSSGQQGLADAGVGPGDEG
jgi:hypothetical protein